MDVSLDVRRGKGYSQEQQGMHGGWHGLFTHSELRYGTCTCPVCFRFAFSARNTFPRVDNDSLIDIASSSSWPVTPDTLSRSKPVENRKKKRVMCATHMPSLMVPLPVLLLCVVRHTPARSPRTDTPSTTDLPSGPAPSTSTVKMQWLQYACAKM